MQIKAIYNAEDWKVQLGILIYISMAVCNTKRAMFNTDSIRRFSDSECPKPMERYNSPIHTHVSDIDMEQHTG